MLTKDQQKDLKLAKASYQKKNYDEALKSYEILYEEFGDEFNIWDKRFYAWSIYQVNIKNPTSEESLIENGEKITKLVTQEDTTKNDICCYTLTLMKILDFYYKQRLLQFK